MARIGRPPSCECGTCPRCRRNAKQRKQWHSKSLEEKQAIAARRDKDKIRAADKRRYENPERKAYAKAYAIAWGDKHPEVRKARRDMNNAIRDGRFERGTACEQAGKDCYGRIEAHHEDYSKPFEVRWLCASHHRRWHAENGSCSEPEVSVPFS